MAGEDKRKFTGTASFDSGRGNTMRIQFLEVENDFNLSIKHITQHQTFVPLGISDFNGESENEYLEFEIEITEGYVDDFQVEILHDDVVLQTFISGMQRLDEVVITAKGSGNTPNPDTSNDQSPLINYPEGTYHFEWDGFDSNGMYDSTVFTNGKLKARLTGTQNGKEKTVESDEFSFEYGEVTWVDSKINKISKRIDITLRVNLTDGGENGTAEDCHTVGSGSYAPERKICPWDKIPKEVLSYYKKSIIKKQTSDFNKLKKMVLSGMNTYWSRRYTNTKGTIINNTNWEIIVTAINTNKSNVSLNDIPLIYNTNNPWSRSGNTGGSYDDGNWDDEAMGLLPNGIVQRISFNVGYIQYSDWKDLETNHELLQAYYGTTYSWQHKGTSYYLPQDKKPLKEESFKEEYINIDFMEETKGEDYPLSGEEVDLMKYYHNDLNKKNRIVAAEKDVLGILWLTKLELK